MRNLLARRKKRHGWKIINLIIRKWFLSYGWEKSKHKSRKVFSSSSPTPAASSSLSQEKRIKFSLSSSSSLLRVTRSLRAKNFFFFVYLIVIVSSLAFQHLRIFEWVAKAKKENSQNFASTARVVKSSSDVLTLAVLSLRGKDSRFIVGMESRGMSLSRWKWGQDAFSFDKSSS